MVIYSKANTVLQEIKINTYLNNKYKYNCKFFPSKLIKPYNLKYIFFKSVIKKNCYVYLLNNKFNKFIGKLYIPINNLSGYGYSFFNKNEIKKNFCVSVNIYTEIYIIYDK
jgi:hypothetical protein